MGDSTHLESLELQRESLVATIREDGERLSVIESLIAAQRSPYAIGDIVRYKRDGSRFRVTEFVYRGWGGGYSMRGIRILRNGADSTHTTNLHFPDDYERDRPVGSSEAA